MSIRTATYPGAPPRLAAPVHQGPLDGLRAAAAGAVLLTHVAGLTGYSLGGTPLSWVLSRGDVGVPIFFALSGMLLYRPWAAAALVGEPAAPLTSYLRRRALRILPAYWAVVLITMPTLNPGPSRHAWPWIQYLLLAQNYDPHPWWHGTGANGLSQAWSLVVEASFYLVLPLLAAAATWFALRGGGAGDVSRRARRLLTVLATVAVASFGWTVLAYYPRPEFWFAGTLPPLAIWFCVGMGIAVALAWASAEPEPDGPALRFCRSVAASGGMCCLIAACAFAIACTPLAGPEFGGIPSLWETEFKTALYTLVTAAIVAPIAFQPSRAGTRPGTLACRLLGSRSGRFLGRISYGVFLWQFLVAAALFTALHLKNAIAGGTYTLPQAAGILLAIALLTVATATLSYYLLERPVQRLWTSSRRRASGRHRRDP